VLDTASQDRPRIPLWLQLPIFAVVGCCLVILAAIVFIHFQQHSLIYHPRPYSHIYAHVLPPNGVEIEYALPFGKQTAFYISPPNEPPKRVWVAFCGNGSLALDWTGLLPGYPPNGDAFLLVDYPGYGKNSGYATIDSTRATADGAVHALANRLHVDQEQRRHSTLPRTIASNTSSWSRRLPVCAMKPPPLSANISPVCSLRTTTIAKISVRSSNTIRRCASTFSTELTTTSFPCGWGAHSQRNFLRSAIAKFVARIT
jgi:hypothetical protein